MLVGLRNRPTVTPSTTFRTSSDVSRHLQILKGSLRVPKTCTTCTTCKICKTWPSAICLSTSGSRTYPLLLNAKSAKFRGHKTQFCATPRKKIITQRWRRRTPEEMARSFAPFPKMPSRTSSSWWSSLPASSWSWS